MHGWEKKPRLLLNLIDLENLEYNLKLNPLGMGVLLYLPITTNFLWQKSSIGRAADHMLTCEKVKIYV